jgi:hypothetical protein
MYIKMILLIRGHIRNSFENSNFFDLVKTIIDLDNDVSIYIHTWNVIANDISWRTVEKNDTIVTKEFIYNYFNEYKIFIKNIIIDDDKNIEIIGNKDGKINNYKMPLIGWKNYWYGKYKLINYVKELDIYGDDDLIVNLRFDVLSNSHSFDKDTILEFIKKNKNSKITKNIFIKNYECYGIDNIYIGNCNTMHKITKLFANHLDEIFDEMEKEMENNMIEKNVFRMNDQLFPS